jgi:cullin 1
MLIDKHQSIEINNNFSDFLKDESDGRFSISLLKNIVWPIKKNENLVIFNPKNNNFNFEFDNLDLSIKKYFNFEKYFLNYYKNIDSSKDIHYCYSYYKIELFFNMNYETENLRKSYVIKCNFYDSLILFLFNKKNLLNLNDLYILLHFIPKDTITSSLKSILNSKILLKKNDIILFNQNINFKNNIIKFKNLKDDISNVDNSHGIHLDRLYYIDSIIIKILKSKKKMKYNLLVHEVTEVCKERFVLDIKDFKKRIDYLIENQYLLRVLEDNEIFILYV